MKCTPLLPNPPDLKFNHAVNSYDIIANAIEQINAKMECIIIERVTELWPDFNFDDFIKSPSNRLTRWEEEGSIIIYLDNIRLVTFLPLDINTVDMFLKNGFSDFSLILQYF